jgi:universal stress protein E
MVPAADIDSAVLIEFEKHRNLLEDDLKKHSITTEHVHLPKGDAVHAIPELVKELGVDLLVTGTVCRTGIPGFIKVNTAEQVLATVECSTLTVKSEVLSRPLHHKFRQRGLNHERGLIILQTVGRFSIILISV